MVFLSALPSVKLVRLTHNSSVAEAHAANFATDFEFIRFICLYVYT